MKTEMSFTESVITHEILSLSLLLLLVIYAVTPLKEKFSYRSLFLAEFAILVLPIVLILTYLSEYLLPTLIAQIILICALLGTKFTTEKLYWAMKLKVKNGKQHAWVANLRPALYLVTNVCIFATNFNVFATKFKKTIEFGYSLMDTGVGLFVSSMCFSQWLKIHGTARGKSLRENGVRENGVREKGAQERDAEEKYAQGKSATVSIYQAFLSAFPLFSLGVSRAVIIRILSYPRSVTEYGVDWNFFFTLGSLKFFNALFWPLLRSRRSLLFAAFCFLVAHQSALHFGLEKWIMSDAPRIAFFEANREGIFSLAGYQVIYLIFAFTSDFAPFLKTGDSISQYLGPLAKMVILASIFAIATIYSDDIFGVSRRTANTGFMFWLACLNVISVINGVLFDVICIALASDVDYPRPILVDCINRYGLRFFLLGNFVTGFTRMSINTENASNGVGFLLITAYAFVCCAVVAVAARRK